MDGNITRALHTRKLRFKIRAGRVKVEPDCELQSPGRTTTRYPLPRGRVPDVGGQRGGESGKSGVHVGSKARGQGLAPIPVSTRMAPWTAFTSPLTSISMSRLKSCGQASGQSQCAMADTA